MDIVKLNHKTKPLNIIKVIILNEIAPRGLLQFWFEKLIVSSYELSFDFHKFINYFSKHENA